jgi:hypothetical protein
VPGSAADRLARLADGYLITQLLHVAIALGVPEALAHGPRSAEDLADELGAVPGRPPAVGAPTTSTICALSRRR